MLTTPVDQRQHLSSTYLKRRANLAESYDSEGCRNEAELDQKAVFTHSTMNGLWENGTSATDCGDPTFSMVELLALHVSDGLLRDDSSY